MIGWTCGCDQMNFKKGSVVISGGKTNFLTLETIWLTVLAYLKGFDRQ